MSAAQSNTQSASFNSRGGKSSRGGNARSSSLSDEPAEFKALRNKYSSGLKTLNEMFPDWTDIDLLSAIKEADGNLETAVTHIAEGFATQWGEVKSRKEKRQAAKLHQDESKPLEKSSHVPRPASFRGGVRGGAARGGRGGHSHASARARPVSASKERTASSADSVAPVWDMDASSSLKNATGGWDTKSTAVQDSKAKEQKPAAAISGARSGAPTKPAPMSWASIAKK
ncbi:hypothetical protein BX070DRAFT_146647 [Coemansia spiralis]|nr:hypothetical protein BX070DRAFT_146647 [Coemansia spiralis]